MTAVEGDWAKCVGLPIFCKPRNQLSRMGIPETGPMTGVSDGLSIWGERHLTVDGGTTYFELRRPRACVDGLNRTCSSDDQDGLAIPAEPDDSVVSFIRTEKPGTGRLFKSVYAQISAGDREQVLIGAK